MKEPKKPRADSKLKNLPELIQEGFWLLLHPSDPEVKAYTLEDLGGEIFDKHQISVGLATLSEWRSWYALKRRMEMATERAEQVRLELAKDPDVSVETLNKIAQKVFTAETLGDGNLKGFVAMGRLLEMQKKNKIAETTVEQNERKLAIAEKALKQNERKLKLLERKAEFADEVKKVAANREGGITAEEMADIERRLKLM